MPAPFRPCWWTRDPVYIALARAGVVPYRPDYCTATELRHPTLATLALRRAGEGGLREYVRDFAPGRTP
jgi:hypothetical protein